MLTHEKITGPNWVARRIFINLPPEIYSLNPIQEHTFQIEKLRFWTIFENIPEFSKKFSGDEFKS